MSQSPPIANDEDSATVAGAPPPAEQIANELEEQVTDDVGGVQGSAPGEDEPSSKVQGVSTGSPDDQAAPDAGEIEWAGQLVKKPPTPGA